ncbi:hypothetical protein ALI22I_10040 [Saccharothrix sp. ALI-22-I]|nr:hypothetical protein ALI22I_10040 [Saccharothrix sp. ALI-22-I]
MIARSAGRRARSTVRSGLSGWRRPAVVALGQHRAARRRGGAAAQGPAAEPAWRKRVTGDLRIGYDPAKGPWRRPTAGPAGPSSDAIAAGADCAGGVRRPTVTAPCGTGVLRWIRQNACVFRAGQGARSRP